MLNSIAYNKSTIFRMAESSGGSGTPQGPNPEQGSDPEQRKDGQITQHLTSEQPPNGNCQ